MEENASNGKQKAQIAKKDVLEKLNFSMDAIKIANKERMIKAKAAQIGYNYIDLSNFPIAPEALKIIDQENAEKYKMACFYYGGKEARIGAVNLTDENTIQFISQLKERFFNKNFQIYLISEHSFLKIMSLYEKLPKIKVIQQVIQITKEDLVKFKEIKNFKQVTKSLKKVSLTEILNLLLSSAINIDASDIHIEAEKDDVKIRYRVDGTLHDAAVMDKNKWNILVSRIKLISGLKINISDKPQDGRFTISLDKDQIDIRVSTLPTVYGESVAIRILMFSRKSFTLTELGLREEIYSVLKKGINRPNGLIFNTGPTGSGKTSTLYAILNELNQENVKIITIEDPIE
ncbi:Flp pilus assembly complex ATPase component TadA, partial [Candidatus Parcubacteria bacterium]|nr:Flp pilus assembly complex ATPase component TadA [Candidatus Parcubacteria bacterium]